MYAMHLPFPDEGTPERDRWIEMRKACGLELSGLIPPGKEKDVAYIGGYYNASIGNPRHVNNNLGHSAEYIKAWYQGWDDAHGDMNGHRNDYQIP